MLLVGFAIIRLGLEPRGLCFERTESRQEV
jgi:hypothetical protein